jgi:hypothetical protein
MSMKGRSDGQCRDIEKKRMTSASCSGMVLVFEMEVKLDVESRHEPKPAVIVDSLGPCYDGPTTVLSRA